MVIALALVHHLAIGNNVPMEKIAEYFSALGRWLIIEYVPKSDSQVELMLTTRDDVFPKYTQEGFEDAFKKYFHIREAVNVTDSNRVLFLLERRTK